jgi:hypothetical protein
LKSKCPNFESTKDFSEAWNNAKENIGRGLNTKKRKVFHFELGDIQRFMNHMLSSTSTNYTMHREVMLWASLLFFTGMRPGEAAYTKGYKKFHHYLRVKDVEVRCMETDDYGVCFSILIKISWLKHNRFRGETYVHPSFYYY